jgi:hypothetical protein
MMPAYDDSLPTFCAAGPGGEYHNVTEAEAAEHGLTPVPCPHHDAPGHLHRTPEEVAEGLLDLTWPDNRDQAD